MNNSFFFIFNIEPLNYVYIEWINKLKEGFDFLSSNNSLPQAKPKNSSSTNNQGNLSFVF